MNKREIYQCIAESQNELSQESATDMLKRTEEFSDIIHEASGKAHLPLAVLIGILQLEIMHIHQKIIEMRNEISRKK